jgi:hypothetical protein
MKQKIFLEGSEVRLNGDDQCYRFLKTQAISGPLAKSSADALELVFEDGKLIKKFNWQYEFRYELDIEKDEIGFPYFPVSEHVYFALQKAKQGDSFLGGELPEGFQLPKLDSRPAFQFLGTLSPKTEGLEWLPFDFHITVPIYGSFLQLFLDYSDPMHPQIWDTEAYINSDYEDNYVKFDTELVYEKEFLKSKKLKKMPDFFEENLGYLGVPHWIQNPHILNCPKTGDLMRFVAQFGRSVDIKLKRANIEVPNEGYYAELLGRMNFWADGDLYVFLNPNSKMACVIIQH